MADRSSPKSVFASPFGMWRGSKKISELERRIEELEEKLVRERTIAVNLEAALATRKRQPILITTMPKSGTYYISKVLSEGLAMNTRIVSNQYFPYDTIRYFELKELFNNGEISQDHFDPSQINVWNIANFSDRIIVNVRDPRQAMLSWLHYIDAFKVNEETYQFIYPQLPRSFFDRSLSDRIDWAIEQWLPLICEWTEGWLGVEQRGELKVLFTRFEDMVVNEDAFFQKILDFFSIPKEHFWKRPVERDGKTHFRKGETDEWRLELSKSQQRAAAKKIPGQLAEAMMWDFD